MPGLLSTAEAMGGGTEFELEDAVEELELGVRKVAMLGGGPELRCLRPPPATGPLAAAAILNSTLV